MVEFSNLFLLEASYSERAISSFGIKMEFLDRKEYSNNTVRWLSADQCLSCWRMQIGLWFE
jgi:hypothetical protein